MKVALAQIAPVWLDRDATLQKIMTATRDAAEQGAELVVLFDGISIVLDLYAHENHVSAGTVLPKHLREGIGRNNDLGFGPEPGGIN